MTNTSLELHSDYSRQDVHSIFSPDTTFTPQAGTWGLHGIVDVPDRDGDYVFFVTFGQSQGKHHFDEFITDEGVLSWQSQPRQGLDDPRIQDFIQHDEESSNIHLFLRTEKGRDYTYLGVLKYLDHDPTKERPVYFQWQILDWPPTQEVLQHVGLKLSPVTTSESITSEIVRSQPANCLTITDTPPGRTRGAASTKRKARACRPDYLRNHEENQKLGLLGELLVVQWEKDRLNAAGQPELAQKVRHVSVLENDTAGYDILSFEEDGTKRFIEVKTTRGSADADFFMSANELVFANRHASRYFLYRLYDYLDAANTANCFLLQGDPATTQVLQMTPTAYKVAIRSGS